MDRREFLIGGSIVWLALGAAGASDAFPGLEIYADRFVARSDFWGVIAIRRGSLQRVSCTGYSDRASGTKTSEGDCFAIGSISKHMTSVSVLLLQKAGKLSVTDRLSTLLPELATGEITLSHMMSHTSGIARDFPVVTDRLTPEGAVRLAAHMKLVTGPIGQYAYSNVEYALLSAVVERASGMPFNQFLTTHLFEPVGMHATGGFGAVRPPRLVTPYIPQLGRAVTAVPNSWKEAVPGAGAVYSTVGDMMRWDSALWDGRIIPADVRTALITERVPGYGYGISVGKRLGHTVVGHDGQMTGFVARYDHFPGADAALVILGNVDTQAIEIMTRGLTQIAFRENADPPDLPVLSARPVDSGVARNYAGTYAVTPTFSFDVVAKTDGLYIPGNGKHLSALTPMVGGGFFYRELYARVHFTGAGKEPAPELIWTDPSGATYHCKRAT
ncbi:MAG TPA: serine hydrolase domain-containing protein [Candidatus Eremiobacteraceae bacterium]|jgi:CubicO group peptidase (beta-lactamase class C family)